MTRRIATLLAAAALCLLTGCTGIPDSSSPQTVAPVPLQQDETTASGPPRDAIPLVIMQKFLDANAAADPTTASAYLTKRAAATWSPPQRVTIISDEQIPNPNPRTGQAQVTGRVVGTINSAGIYQPSLQNVGNGGALTDFPFTLTRVGGQNRIDKLPTGLLIDTDQFRDRFVAHTLFFDDLSQRNVVPDLRWSAIPTDEPAALATWLVRELAAGPNPEISDGVASVFPAQADPARILVRSLSDGSLSIEIPGSSQMEPTGRRLLATQLARTLEQVGGELTITDDAAPVSIPVPGSSEASTTFDLATLVPSSTAPPTKPSVYYLDDGALTAESGRTSPGPLGNDANNDYYLDSVALANRRLGRSARPGLAVAAVQGPAAATQLWVGTQFGGLSPTDVRGVLTRPCWAPNASEVWVGVGNTLHRVVVNGSGKTITAKDSTVELPPLAGVGRFLSVRLSPDGTQVALVVAAPGYPSGQSIAGQLFVGAVVRDPGRPVRIGTLMPVSPSGVAVVDADWQTSQRLTVVGAYTSSGVGTVSDVSVDGSTWVNHGPSSLPAVPTSVTATGYGIWLASGPLVYRQEDGAWVSPNSDATSGYAPTYVVG